MNPNTRKQIQRILAAAAFAAGCATATASLVTYVDFGTQGGGAGSSGNVTIVANGSTATTSLKNMADGTLTGWTISLAGAYIGADSLASGTLTGDALAWFTAPGLNVNGRRYGSGAATLTFSGLTPGEKYSFAEYINDAPGISNQRTVLSGMLSGFTNDSSTGMTISTTASTNDTTQGGNLSANKSKIFRYSNIDPGPDGIFQVALSDTGWGLYDISAVRLEQMSPVPEPASVLSLAGLLGMSVFMRWRRG